MMVEERVVKALTYGQDYLLKEGLVSEEDLARQEALEVTLLPAQLVCLAAMSSSDGWDRFNGGPSINQLVSLAEGLDNHTSSFRVVLSKDGPTGYNMEVRDFHVGVDITKDGEVGRILTVFAENALERPHVFHTYRSGHTFMVFASWEEQ